MTPTRLGLGLVLAASTTTALEMHDGLSDVQHPDFHIDGFRVKAIHVVRHDKETKEPVAMFRRRLRSVHSMVLSPCCFKGWGGKEAQRRAKARGVDAYEQLCEVPAHTQRGAYRGQCGGQWGLMASDGI